jgi:hypothetical protein
MLVGTRSFFDSSAAVKLLLELTLGVIPSMLLISADTVSFFDVTEINFVKIQCRHLGRLEELT